jgi:hypothetical protein
MCVNFSDDDTNRLEVVANTNLTFKYSYMYISTRVVSLIALAMH